TGRLVGGLADKDSRFIWMPDVDVVSCSTDPRCVAKEHYVTPTNGTDLSLEVPDEERGVIKLWQMLVVDYVSHHHLR
ncbi:UNVERIFIED_CONTAM: hypothetical protein NY603_28180, partial [Bacteroidetes bacterium 56_B9]